MTVALERDSALPSTLEIAPRRFTFAEYWILNLHAQQLEVRCDPSGEDYLETRKYKVGESVATLEFRNVPLEWWV
jgi:hypothetical protein